MAEPDPLHTNMIDRLAEGGPRAIDIFLRPCVARLKIEYAAGGNPSATYATAVGFAESLGELPGSGFSFQYSQLLGLMAEMLIAEGKDKGKLLTALELIEDATEILFRVSTVPDEVVSVHVSQSLHLAVARKALGEYEEAINGLRNAQKVLSRQLGLSSIDMVMLSRQEVMMQQDARAYRKLGEQAAIYVRSKPIQYYGTVKRIFEFALNEGMMDDARAILPEFKRAFRAVHQKLPVLSHVSFTKNVGHYLLSEGRTGEGTNLLLASLRAAEENNLHGQQRQIRGLLGGGTKDRVPKLKTFTVG